MQFPKLNAREVREKCERARQTALINAFLVTVIREELNKWVGKVVNKRIETAVSTRIAHIKHINEDLNNAWVAIGSPSFRLWYDNKKGFAGRDEFVLDVGYWASDRIGGEQGVRLTMPRDLNNADLIAKHFGVGWDCHEQTARALASKMEDIDAYVIRYNAAIDALQAAHTEAATFEDDTVYPLTSLFDPRSH